MTKTAILACLLMVGCAETGQDDIEVPLYLAGTDVSEPFAADDGTLVSIDRADLAFGPLYLCAGSRAGELCETARLEWIESAVVHTPDALPFQAGMLSGTSGPVRSWMYDLGLSSLLTQEAPLVLAAAQELDGVSLHVEGRAEFETGVVGFVADIAIQQEEETELGVPVVGRSTTDTFDHDVQPGERGLLVRFDPRPWFSGIAYSVLCDPSVGCAEPTRIEAGSQAYRSIRNAILAEARPSFEWGFAP